MSARYWLMAAAALVRHGRDRDFLASLARAGLDADARPGAPTYFMLDRYPDMEHLQIHIGTFAFRRSNQDPTERFMLAALCALRRPKRIFEIGTFDGSTTLLLAQSAPEARIFTLDLPPDTAGVARVKDEAEQAAAARIGSVFKGTPEGDRIQQLLGDSRSFDFSAWRRSIDLVIVDGGHGYDCTSADTRAALEMIASDGLIVWDDYEIGWPDVIRAVDGSQLPVFHVANTGFAILDTAQ